MGKVILTSAIEADFAGFQNPLEVFNSQGKSMGLFLPLHSYKKLLAHLEIPYSKEELERRRQEKGGMSLQAFRHTLSQR